MLSMLNSLNFSNLSVEGYTALILAVIFTIVCVAAFIFVGRHKTLSKTVVIISTLLFPFLAIFCWVYLILTIFEFSLAMSLYISLGASAGYVVVAFGLSLMIAAIIKATRKHKNNVKEQTETESVAAANEEKEIEETPAETQAVITTLLIGSENQDEQDNQVSIENFEEPKSEIEEQSVSEDEVEEAPVSDEEVLETENLVETEDTTEQDAIVEETIEDTQENEIEEETVEQSETVEAPQTEETIETDISVIDENEEEQPEIEKTEEEIEIIEESQPEIVEEEVVVENIENENVETEEKAEQPADEEQQ